MLFSAGEEFIKRGTQLKAVKTTFVERLIYFVLVEQTNEKKSKDKMEGSSRRTELVDFSMGPISVTCSASRFE